MADSTASTRFDRGPLLLVLAALMIVSVVVSGRVLFRRPPPPPDEPVVDMAQLRRVDGILVWRDDTNRVFAGWVTEAYGEGRPKSRSHVVDGRIHGVSEGWHPNGVLKIQEHFVAGSSEGSVTRWYPDGSKLSEGTSRAGKFEGPFRRWHTNGVLAEELEMVGGEPHGLSRAWYPSGSPKAEARMAQGKVLERKFWPDGGVAQLAVHPPEGGKP